MMNATATATATADAERLEAQLFGEPSVDPPLRFTDAMILAMVGRARASAI